MANGRGVVTERSSPVPGSRSDASQDRPVSRALLRAGCGQCFGDGRPTVGPDRARTFSRHIVRSVTRSRRVDERFPARLAGEPRLTQQLNHRDLIVSWNARAADTAAGPTQTRPSTSSAMSSGPGVAMPCRSAHEAADFAAFADPGSVSTCSRAASSTERPDGSCTGRRRAGPCARRGLRCASAAARTADICSRLRSVQ